MKNKTSKLPKMATRSLYGFRSLSVNNLETVSTSGDGTTTCTTVMTTTHFDR